MRSWACAWDTNQMGTHLPKTLPNRATSGQKLHRASLKQQSNILLRKQQASNQQHHIPHRNVLWMDEGKIILFCFCTICQWVNSTSARVSHEMNCPWVCSLKRGQFNQQIMSFQTTSLLWSLTNHASFWTGNQLYPALICTSDTIYTHKHILPCVTLLKGCAVVHR